MINTFDSQDESPVENPPLVSLVVPAFNEGAAISANLRNILDCARQSPLVSFELLLVDDGSKDDTLAWVEEMMRTESAIRLLALTRNFGKEAAIQAGLEYAHGEAVIVIDADLQHPPALIREMVRLWLVGGIPVVEAIKQERGREPLVKGLGAKLFYWGFDKWAKVDLAGQSDFKLLDRTVVDAYLSWPEKQRFFRGLVGWAGFPSAQLPFSVPERAAGQSSWGRLKLLRYAIHNFTSFSSVPLRLVSIFGALALLGGFVIGAISLWQKFRGEALDGFTTVNLLIVGMGGAILLGLGIIGHYLARLYDEVKGRPPYVIKPDVRSRDTDMSGASSSGRKRCRKPDD